jgi:ferredoxin/flavodoxin---NADP+ reductase
MTTDIFVEQTGLVSERRDAPPQQKKTIVLPEPQLNAVVALKNELTPRLMIIRLVADGWQLPEFEPGQFTALGLPGSAPRCALSGPEDPAPDRNKLIRRAYSIASSSLLHEYVEFYISLVSSGALTPRLFALNIGDRVWLSPRISGMFTLDQVPPDKNVVLVATGTGLAPYISMLSSELQCGNQRRFAVLHGAYHSWDLGYRSELLTMQHLCPNFAYFATIDGPDQEPVAWTGPTGFVQELWTKGLVAQAWKFKPTPDNTHVFLCGNPFMIRDMEGLLAQEGFREHSPKQPGEIHVERF